MNKINRARFIWMVVNHFENRRFNPNDPWTVEDSFAEVAGNIDLADMDHREYNQLLSDCRININAYLKLEG